MKPNKFTLIFLLTLVVFYVLFRIFAFVKQDQFVNKRSIPQKNQNEDVKFDRSIGHLILTRHAKCRMDCRNITETELKEILRNGNINYNKSELNDVRGPKYALEGYTTGHQHLRVIFAPEVKDMVVVTCIDLDTEWQCPSCN